MAATDFETLAKKRSEELLNLLSPRWQLWRRPAFDPERRRIFARTLAALWQTRRLHRVENGFDRSSEQELAALLEIEPRSMGVDAAHQHVHAWEQALIRIGDVDYLFALVELELTRAKTEGDRPYSWNWSSLFEKPEPPAGLEDFRTGKSICKGSPEALGAQRKLASLYRTRTALTNIERSRAVMRGDYVLRFVLPILVLFVAGLGIAIRRFEGSWDEILIAAFAGGVGATLSGAYKLRDQVAGITALRAYRATMLAQPVFGSVAGLFLLLILESKVVEVNTLGSDWAVIGVVAFVAGFSEPFVLGVVNSLAGIAEAQRSPDR